MFSICLTEEFVLGLSSSKEYLPKCNQEWCAINSKLGKVIKRIRSSGFILYVKNN